MQAIRAATIAAAAIALTLACASIAHAAVVSDPDEPGIAQDRDIEWASESHVTWPSGSSSITQTIKSYAPYSSRPCLNIRTATERYVACSAKLSNLTARTSKRISMTETADTVTYSFTSGAIGDPTSYRWTALTRGSGAWADHTTSTETVFSSVIAPKITLEKPIPFFLEPDELPIPDRP